MSTLRRIWTVPTARISIIILLGVAALDGRVRGGDGGEPQGDKSIRPRAGTASRSLGR